MGNALKHEEPRTPVVFRKAKDVFCNESKILKLAMRCMEENGLKSHHVLLATSCCPDEINRDLDEEAKDLGRAFCMGGLAGFPFVGRTGFCAFQHHVPAEGCMLIICASHVGIDDDGIVGRVNRIGMEEGTTACGAAVAAFKYCQANEDKVDAIARGDTSAYAGFSDPLDSQQNYIQKFVASEYAGIKARCANNAAEPMAELARVCALRIRKDLEGIIPKGLAFPLVILNGIQINFEGEDVGEDYFCPLSFMLTRPDGTSTDLMSTLRYILVKSIQA